MNAPEGYEEVDSRKALKLASMIIHSTRGPQEAMGLIVQVIHIIDSCQSARLPENRNRSLGDLIKEMIDTSISLPEGPPQ